MTIPQSHREADLLPALPAEPAHAPGAGRTGRVRLRGIDMARGLAVFGMFAAHIGPGVEVGGVIGPLMELTHGRSSILFAILAGISLALMTGGSSPTVPTGRRKKMAAIAIRAVLLLLIGVGLTALSTPVSVILAYYGAFFLIALPFLWLRPRTLCVIGAVTAIVAPVASVPARLWLYGSGAIDVVTRFDPLAPWSRDRLIDLVLTGQYPAVTWMPFLLVGLALGRLSIGRISRRVLIATGVGLAVLGYGSAAIAMRVANRATGLTLDALGEMSQDPFTMNPAWEWRVLLSAGEHTGSTFEIVGGIGVSLIVVWACLWLTERFPRTTWPITAVGTMSLTVYTLHVVAIYAVPAAGLAGTVWVLLAFIAGATLIAIVWLRFVRRGPLETVLHRTVALIPT
ncbi:MAG: DUF418 domain-containing protein [Bifidobacteriaceae bacterium]|nr:DUF418 domain-containing protein [Bifidobacteriaceae bacterium]